MPIPITPSPLATIIATGTYDSNWFPGSTIEEKIQNAINHAAIDGAPRVLVHGPYDANLVIFNTNVKMVLEGEDWGVWNVKAYGANDNNITDSTTAIHAARDGAGVGGPLFFSGKGIYLTTGLTANVANQKWELATGATIKLANGSTTHAIKITAAGVEIKYGTIDGNRNNVSGTARGISVEPTTASPPCIVRDVTVKDSFDDGIFFFLAHDSECLNCRVINHRGNGISNRNSQRLRVENPYVDGSGGAIVAGSDCIAMAATTPGQSINDSKIIGGTVLPGFTGCFGVEIQTAGGDVSHGVIVANVTARFAAACAGGISFSGVQHCVSDNNNVDANGQAATVDAIEFAGCTFCTVTGGTLRGGTTGWPNGIGLDQSSDCTVSAATIDGGSTVGSLAGVKISSSTAVSARGNILRGLRIKLPSAVTATRGIFIQANNAATDCSDTILLGNEIECTTAASNVGIVMDRSGGTLARTLIAYNVLRNCNEGIRPFNDTLTMYGPNSFNGCTNSFGNAAPGAGGSKVRSNDVSADRGDANVTLVLDVDAPTQLFATALTANRTVTLPASRRVQGAAFRIVRTGLGAFTLDVGGLKTIPNSTAAFVDVEYDGTAWRLTGYGTL